MNERIRELAEQSGCKVMDGEWYIPSATGVEKIVYTKGIGLEKFAELIVLECMHECLRMQLGNQYTPEELLFQTKYRKIIKEHFGVKNEGFRSKE
jgi:hypothetical protein